ncbi:hypothetical protein EPA93_27605 [Ktedonosporobacter rubrisoli]|uniref:LSDAT prokaryote domain-containing protein n=1 Tax=Ktedonosporobacter rubrisoli TaxID=2509675 RepID=A0A4P6JVZ9_KTERU|nr:hypothetical protein [Ktedonosporobacter rubrisoli]QBD79540.1 hypothetical protein EPA93_27605 [Ktedonosporobacter rubrisoli]
MHSSRIFFSERNHARVVSTTLAGHVESILEALELEYPAPLIMIAGGAGNFAGQYAALLTHLGTESIVPAAVEAGAVIIDGGSHVGIMQVMGQALLRHGQRRPLLGVAPTGLVTYPGRPSSALTEELVSLDPHHSHFVLVEGNKWGCETEMMYALGRAIAREKGALTLLANGGSIALDEALTTVRHGWPLLVIEGSGRLADDVVRLWRDQAAQIADERLREVVRRGRIVPFHIGASATALKQLILQLLGSEES